MASKVDDAIKSLMDLFYPIEEQSLDRLHEMMKFCNMFNSTPDVDTHLNNAKREIAIRSIRGLTGPTFKTGQIVEVIEGIKWWPNAYAHCPHVGIQGLVLKPHISSLDAYHKSGEPVPDYRHLVPVRFMATDIGYEWDEDTDDFDRQFITYNMPNYTIRVVEKDLPD